MPEKATPLYLVYDGTALEHSVFRVVSSCPPRVDDFRSHEALGRGYDRRDYFRALGVSFYRTREQASVIRRRFGHGPAIAAVEMRQDGVVWAATGGHEHLTVWGPPEILLAGVVQCDEDDL